MHPASEITVLLRALTAGELEALDKLHAMLYDELRTLARHHLKNEREGHTLNPTALVNEAYLRLSRHEAINAPERNQFFAVAGITMRRILVDYARARKSKKRGGDQKEVQFESVKPFLSERESEEIIALEDALTELTKINERASKVVEYRFYCGLSLDETAQLLHVSTKTVQRDWLFAQAWLRKEVYQLLS